MERWPQILINPQRGRRKQERMDKIKCTFMYMYGERTGGRDGGRESNRQETTLMGCFKFWFSVTFLC